MNGKQRMIHWTLYWFSLLTWLANVGFIVLWFFADIPAVWIVVIFLAVLLEGVFSEAFEDKSIVPERFYQKRFLDHCLSVSKFVSIVLAAVGGLSIVIAGGKPEIQGEALYVVNHGSVVREISEGWFLYLSACEFGIFCFGMLIFSTYMAMRIRTMYCNQKEWYDGEKA